MNGDYFHPKLTNYDEKKFKKTSFWGILRLQNSNFASIFVFELSKCTIIAIQNNYSLVYLN